NEKATSEYKNEKANAIVDMVGNWQVLQMSCEARRQPTCTERRHDSVHATKGALNFSKSIETITVADTGTLH
ncbi:hypothetical protein Tco_1538903, partial [Tanacetum coccineum]